MLAGGPASGPAARCASRSATPPSSASVDCPARSNRRAERRPGDASSASGASSGQAASAARLTHHRIGQSGRIRSLRQRLRIVGSRRPAARRRPAAARRAAGGSSSTFSKALAALRLRNSAALSMMSDAPAGLGRRQVHEAHVTSRTSSTDDLAAQLAGACRVEAPRSGSSAGRHGCPRRRGGTRGAMARPARGCRPNAPPASSRRANRIRQGRLADPGRTGATARRGAGAPAAIASGQHGLRCFACPSQQACWRAAPATRSSGVEPGDAPEPGDRLPARFAHRRRRPAHRRPRPARQRCGVPRRRWHAKPARTRAKERLGTQAFVPIQPAAPCRASRARATSAESTCSIECQVGAPSRGIAASVAMLAAVVNPGQSPGRPWWNPKKRSHTTHSSGRRAPGGSWPARWSDARGKMQQRLGQRGDQSNFARRAAAERNRLSARRAARLAGRAVTGSPRRLRSRSARSRRLGRLARRLAAFQRDEQLSFR